MSKKKIIILALSIMIIAAPAAGCRDMEMTDETIEPESVSEVTEIPETEEQTTTETTAETTTTTTTKKSTTAAEYSRVGVSGSGGVRRNEIQNAVASSSKKKTTTKRTTTKRTTTQRTKKTTTDPYHAKDFYNPEEFYDEHYDDFFDYYDAEDYWYDHQK